MPSTTALRWLLGGCLSLGALDLLLIDVVLAPEVVADSVVTPRFAAPAAALVATTATPVIPPPAPVDAPAVVRAHIYFETMSATIDGKARAALDALVVDGEIVLEGHADERGDDRYNAKLGKKRALAVQQYLVERGAARERIEVRSAGEDGADDPDLWRDRRVDIQITGGPR